MKLLELYTSVQGEGPHTSEPTQFVRFAGCNLRCPGWPCDTQHAIHPKLYKDVAENLTGAQIVRERLADWPKHICLTGGEPFIQKEIELEEFVQEARAAGYTIECFTNGTQLIPNWTLGRVRFMMDWKLSNSGEVMDRYRDARMANAVRLNKHDGIKFVVATPGCLDEAATVYAGLIQQGVEAQIWIGAVWNRGLSDAAIVDYIMTHKLPWNLNIQTHKYIWHPDKQGV